MSEFTEKDIRELESIESTDNLLLLREVKALREEIRELKGSMNKDKSPARKRAEILNIKDTQKRLKAISENLELFK